MTWPKCPKCKDWHDDTLQCGAPPRPPEGKHSPLIEFARWFNTGDPQGREDYMRLLAMFEAQQTLNAKLVAALEMITERYFDDIGRIDLNEIGALLKEAAK